VRLVPASPGQPLIFLRKRGTDDSKKSGSENDHALAAPRSCPPDHRGCHCCSVHPCFAAIMRPSAELRLDAETVQVFECDPLPSIEDTVAAARIENWKTALRRRGQAFVLIFSRDLHTHSSIGDGKSIQTSAGALFDRHPKLLRTMNRLDVLGQPAGTTSGVGVHL